MRPSIEGPRVTFDAKNRCGPVGTNLGVSRGRARSKENCKKSARGPRVDARSMAKSVAIGHDSGCDAASSAFEQARKRNDARDHETKGHLWLPPRGVPGGD